MICFKPQNFYCHKLKPVGDNNLYVLDKDAPRYLEEHYTFVRKATKIIGPWYRLGGTIAAQAGDMLPLAAMQNLSSFEKMDIEIEALQRELNQIAPIFGEDNVIVSSRRKELTRLQRVRQFSFSRAI